MGSEFCIAHCTTAQPSPEMQEFHHENAPQSIAQLVVISEIYREFTGMFRESSVKELPPHLPFDCSIDIFPDAIVPYWQFFSLSPLERQALREYLDANLENGLIAPFNSPVGAALFFVPKNGASELDLV